MAQFGGLIPGADVLNRELFGVEPFNPLPSPPIGLPTNFGNGPIPFDPFTKCYKCGFNKSTFF
jgi:hypothetical protein